MSVTAKSKEIFLSALANPHPADRDAYLREACGSDVELRQHVDALLKEHEAPDSLLDQPRIDACGAVFNEFETSAVDRPVSEQSGTVIGCYKLLEQIGEGGMGVVFMAEQTEPLQRTVALKIIKPGMDTKQVIARFEAERQAVAMMDHPNIAKVLDAGTTESGRPYFVMDLVKGIPITDYCDQQHLSVRQRLELFTQVCHAVQHAHQKGIIHRDLKPSNVLVAEYDGRPVPKIIDFGVAKATAQRLTERTMFTQYGQIVGTFEYMSPEQARFNQLDVDTRSDIYSLGVLLYELLAGSTPLEKERLRSAAFDEILRIISEEDPPRPSTRLSSSEALPSIAANRGLEPKKLSGLVRGELDWIVMKCLEKDRNRRYETASGFAADIERHLHDEPVQAGPPSAAYRFRKFARRNKAAVLVVSVIVASLIAATSVSVWQAAIARDALRLAGTRLESETRARKEADAAKVQAKNEAARAEAEAEKATTSAQTAQAVIDFLNWDLLGQANDNLPRDRHTRADGEVTLRGALDRAAGKLEGRFPDKPLVEAAVRHMIGFTYSSFGDEFLPQAEPHLARALELRRIHLGEGHLETIRSLMMLAYVRQDVQLQRDAVVHAGRALGDKHELTQSCRFNLAVGLMQIGQHAEAASLLREVLAAKRRTLGSQHPDTAWTAHCLACTLNRGDVAPAGNREIEQLFREALSVSLQSRGDWSWHTSDIALRFGQFLRSRGRLEEAAKVLQDGYFRLESGPVNLQWVVPLVQELEALYQEWEKPEQVAQWRQKAELVTQKRLASSSRLLRENLDDPDLLISHASLLAQLCQYQGAEAAYRLAIDLDPNGHPRARYRLATLCLYTGDLDGYRATCREMLERYGTSDDPHYIDCTAKICLLVPDADGNRERALALADRNVLGTEKHPANRWFVLAKGLADYRAGRYADAVKQLERFAPEAGGGHSDATGFAILAMAHHGLHQADNARNALASARKILSNTMPDPEKGRPFGDDWLDWLHSQILFREAEGMIEKEADDSKLETETDQK